MSLTIEKQFFISVNYVLLPLKDALPVNCCFIVNVKVPMRNELTLCYFVLATCKTKSYHLGKGAYDFTVFSRFI